MSSDKQVIVKSYLQPSKKPPNLIGEQKENQSFYQCKEPSSPVEK